MRRTLQTALLATDWLTSRGVTITANANWQENSDKPCDTGSSVDLLKTEFHSVNFDAVDPVWPDKTTEAGHLYAYTRQAVLDRGRRCLEELSHRPEKLIFVVSHSSFLRLGLSGWWWFNSDYRIFELEQTTEAIKLKQNEETLAGGLGLSWTSPVVIGSELPGDDVSALEPLW